MIKNIVVILVLLLSGCTLMPDSASNTVSNSTIIEIDKVLEDIAQEQGYPGISLVVSFKGSIYTNQIGYSDITEEKELDNETIFRMYSLTKGITEILAKRLNESGLLDLDIAISYYLPNLPSHIQNITSQQLISHRSGIRHYTSNDEWLRLSKNNCPSPLVALAQFVDDPLISEPGSETNYSSFGYVLLSAVLEAAGHKPFEELVNEYIFIPSKISRIEFDNPSSNEPQNVTKFYEPAGEIYIEAPPIDNSCKFGGGAINASPESLANIFSFFYSDALTSQALPSRISLGGEGLGGRSALIAIPGEKVVVIIVANARGGNLQPYAAKIAALILEFEGS